MACVPSVRRKNAAGSAETPQRWQERHSETGPTFMNDAEFGWAWNLQSSEWISKRSEMIGKCVPKPKPPSVPRPLQCWPS
jgi:hypothetical protein